MGEMIPPESKPTPPRGVDLHASVTLAPPSPLPAFAAQGDAHLRAALDAGSRAGSNLSELSRTVRELALGLSGAKQANEQLVQELETLRSLLGDAGEQRRMLAERIVKLEQELSEKDATLRRERQFLTDQHDEFLAALLDEHEEALHGRVRSETARVSPHAAEPDERSHAEAPRTGADSEREVAEATRFALESELARAREALFQAQRARDEAQARAEKRERERDELRAEASQLRARLGTNRSSSAPPPPAPLHSKPPSFMPPGALTLDDGELDSNLHARGMTPRMPSVVPRLGASLAPERLRRSSPSSSPDATVTPFPRETTRPGVGGPKPSEPPPPPSFGPPPSGWTPPPPAAEPTPTAPRLQSAAYLPQGLPSLTPILRAKPDPTTRPLIDYSLGEGGVQSELLEGARLSSTPPRK
ncbi:MAG: hypothetical protein K0R38_1705 [Polyangiaceae bacterium]|jgi:hypothetical protein|nr:hypothetical protein [Polyangiaceae bacterium]